MEREFDSSDYEGASDYAFHMIQHDDISETTAIMRAAKHYNIKWQDLQSYIDSFN